jgi:hypothetical protein
MKIPRNVFGKMAETILEGGAKKVIRILDAKTTVKATLQGKPDKHDSRVTILFTMGSPNYEERQIIKQYRKAGEPLPAKRHIIKWPKKG